MPRPMRARGLSPGQPPVLTVGMPKLIVVENVSLDGVMQGPGRPDEDTRGDFVHGGWAAERLGRDPEAARASMGGMGSTAALLFGHRTYTDLVGHWLSTPDPNPFTQVLRDTPKYVASRQADAELPHPNSIQLADDAAAAVAELKAGDLAGDIVVLGSGELVRSLAAAGLVDEYLLTTVPVVLGSGTRLFGDTYAELEVASSFTSPTGIVVAAYRVVG
jgi:dihydrofolate reductase